MKEFFQGSFELFLSLEKVLHIGRLLKALIPE